MSIDPEFTAVARLARSAATVDAGLAALVHHLARAHELGQALRDVDPAEDVASVRAQLERLLETEPPPTVVAAVYFGLFDTADEDGARSWTLSSALKSSRTSLVATRRAT